MKRKPLTMLRLSLLNLRGSAFRTGALIFIALVLSFSLFVGFIISISLSNGIDTAINRLGADMAVIPMGHEAQYEGFILSGQPGLFYFDRAAEEQIAGIEGVAQVTGQFFLTSLSHECCTTARVQIIGIDPETDFVTMPWISRVYASGLSDGEIIVGSDIEVDESKEITFYDVTYKVVAQLEKSLTGMDHSVFVTQNTIREMADAAGELGVNLSADIFKGDVDNSLSLVLLNIADGYDARRVSLSIRREVSGISVIISNSIFAEISERLGVFVTFFTAIPIAIVFLAVIILSVLYAFGVNVRKKEFAVMRLLGATRKKVVFAVLAESFIATAFGSLIGLTLAVLAIFPFSAYIEARLAMPFLLPDINRIISLLMVCLLVSLLAGTLSAIFSAFKISRAETYITMREGE